ncbi:hypothetical protein EVAR_57741_1 [Eumeta japonica]|uniref:Uncharacterized protein n=1 Tax=Eumeta variegata TaxID=151549 RepID=A0A4C1Y637_EUMVA|nr:hypothetical protein EVAR_57741_1 [Eumeta japonica]
MRGFILFKISLRKTGLCMWPSSSISRNTATQLRVVIAKSFILRPLSVSLDITLTSFNTSSTGCSDRPNFFSSAVMLSSGFKFAASRWHTAVRAFSCPATRNRGLYSYVNAVPSYEF